MRVSHRAAVAVGVLLAIPACGGSPEPPAAVTDRGDAERGRELVLERGCAACHSIPEVWGHDAFVGPPLEAWSRRSFIAGRLPNNAANVRRWLEDPQAIRPGSAMPDVPLTDGEVDDIVAFLFTLD